MFYKKDNEINNFLKKPSKNYQIILIYGSDQVLVSKYANILAKNISVNITDPFLTVYLNAENLEKNPFRLIDESKTIHPSNENRLIWIKHVKSENKLEKIVKILLNNIVKNVFILIESENLKQENSLRKTIENASNSISLPCDKNSEYNINNSINEILLKFHLKISKDVREFLKISFKENQLNFDQEFEEICLYVKNKNEIQKNDIIEAIKEISSLHIKKIVDSIIIGDISIFKKLSHDRKDFLLILSLLQYQFYKILEFQYMIQIQKKKIKDSILNEKSKIIEKAILIWNFEKITWALENIQEGIIKSRKSSVFENIILENTLIMITFEAFKTKQTLLL